MYIVYVCAGKISSASFGGVNAIGIFRGYITGSYIGYFHHHLDPYHLNISVARNTLKYGIISLLSF